MLVFCDFFLLEKIKWWRYCSAQCDEIFDHFPVFDETFRHIELCNSVITNVPHIISLLPAGMGSNFQKYNSQPANQKPFHTLYSKCKILKMWPPIWPVRYISTPDYTFLMPIQKIWHPIRYLFTAGHSIWIQNSKNSVGQPISKW